MILYLRGTVDGMGMSVQRSQLTEYHIHTLGVVTGGVVSLRQVLHSV